MSYRRAKEERELNAPAARLMHSAAEAVLWGGTALVVRVALAYFFKV